MLRPARLVFKPGPRAQTPRANAARVVWAWVWLAGVLVSVAPAARAQQSAPVQNQQAPGPCGSVANAYGPFDYRKDKDRLTIVEQYHFTPKVEQLVSGQSDFIGGDLDYTLRAFPNHHRALLALMRYGDRLKTEHIPYTKYSLRCYFIRAITFKEDDTTVRMLYATYLKNRDQKDEALRQLELAKSFAPDNGFTQYNIGLIYTELGEYQHALEQAHVASALGFALPELKNRLVAANRWAEPASAPR
jgi:tetratricopeptide (TPR) repeat protein